ncbi:MAG: MaoC family dehydratase [Candidatus Nanopelagicales bacterium]
MTEPAHTPSLRTKLPRIPVSLAKAVVPKVRRPGVATVLPSSETTVVGLEVDADRLAEYRELLGSSARMPLAFPQLAATALHLNLLSARSFPVPAMGLVHPGFTVECLGELPLDETWEVRAWIDGQRNVRAGLEFDLRAEVSVDGVSLWRSRAVTLSRSKRAAGPDASGAPVVDSSGPWSRLFSLDVPEDTGRSFARLSGDINPIHLHALSARLFGFKAPIAHGWWLLGRMAALLEADEAVPGRRADIVFRQPVSLPSTPQLRTRTTEGGLHYALFADAAEERPLVAGQIVPG